ncbi:uncharacterized protein LOC101850813 [Aplysia californica]|uniref:Uncharacterized protein LOC101850813 n=1 Tax=Aplysia californica TaxID=6500 RepID=A0ABM1VVE3_APLCA|nr:uncharacterized protein LOC101850813 [Aplysia californica]
MSPFTQAMGGGILSVLFLFCFSLCWIVGTATGSELQFNETCRLNDECAENLQCDNETGTCLCLPSLYYNGSSCVEKIQFNETCTENAVCTENLQCDDLTSKCLCNSSLYYNDSLCVERVGFNQTCPTGSVGSCAEDLQCIGSVCKCQETHYHRGSNQRSPIDNSITVPARIATTGTSRIDYNWTVAPQGFVDNYKVATRSSPQSCLQAQDSKNVPGTSTGVSFTGLRPGAKYLSTLTLVLTATADSPQRSKVVSLPEAWTKPAQPGAVILGSSTLSVPRTVLKFGPSDGCVANYWVTVTRQGSAPQSKRVTNHTVVFENLVANTFYTYTITAYNGDSKPGDSRTGSFTTDGAAPGSVDALSYQQSSVTATGVVVSWRTPSQPNGNLKGYKVWVTAGGQCIKQFHVQCPNCNVSECQSPNPSSPVSQYDSTDLGDSQMVFEVTVTDLLPCTDYIVHVRAYSREVGGGADSEVSFKTSVAAASPVTKVELESLPLTPQGRLDLNVSWVPGYRNGETTFTVVIREKESLTSGNFIEKQRQEFQDTSGVTSYILKNVLGHWVYEVTVEVKTNVGDAAVSSPQTITTFYKHPGPVTALTLTKSTQVASDVSLSFGCPEERERNGVITGFYISKSDRARDPVVQFVTATSCESVFRPPVQVVVGESSTDYTFKVMASNGQYNSSYATSDIMISPLLPEVSEYTATDFTTEWSGSKNTLSSFPVTVCLSCLKDLNSRQGSLTEVVLAVCKNKCGRSGAGTPGGQYVFTVGEDNSCSDTGTDFCNGPLPAGQQYQ